MPNLNLIPFGATTRVSCEFRDDAVPGCPFVDPDSQVYIVFYGPDGSQKYYLFGQSTYQNTDPLGNVTTSTVQPGNILGRLSTGKYFAETEATVAGNWTYQFVGNFTSGVVAISDGAFSVGLDPSV